MKHRQYQRVHLPVWKFDVFFRQNNPFSNQIGSTPCIVSSVEVAVCNLHVTKDDLLLRRELNKAQNPN